MMEPIIKACVTELNTQMEGDVLKVCHSYVIDVDKERLMQALTDARKFYDEGYRDGKRDAVVVVRCKDCEHMKVVGHGFRWCVAWERIQTMGDEGFCNFGERRADSEPR